MRRKIIQYSIVFIFAGSSLQFYAHFFSSAQTEQTNSSHETSTKKYTIVIDLTGVFKESKSAFIKKIGYGAFANYTLTHWKNPGHTCLDMLNHISITYAEQKPQIEVKIKERLLPQCIIDLHKGTKHCKQTQVELLACIEQLNTEHYFKSAKEKKLMHDIIALLFDPQETITLIEPIKPMISLIKKLKANGHAAYFFANIPAELDRALQQHYSDIVNTFDGTVISSTVHMIKPEEAIFKHLFEKHNLNPNRCILIDEQKETCTTAQKFGMKTITYDKPSNVIASLKKLGITI